MKLLLDTHVWLWLQASPDRIEPGTLTQLEDVSNELLLSAASSWEIAIKYALGKLPLPLPPEEFVPGRMERSQVRGLPIEHRHALHVATLPAHHRDPFDRLLIAQAQLEGLPVVTADRQFEEYEVEVRRAEAR